MQRVVETHYLYYGDAEIPVECYHANEKVYLTDDGLYAALKAMVNVTIDKAQTRNTAVAVPAVQDAVPPVPEPEILPADPNEWTQDKLDKMIGLKKRMGITDNEQLNQWVYEWSNGALNSADDIVPSNVDSFVEYINLNA